MHTAHQHRDHLLGCIEPSRLLNVYAVLVMLVLVGCDFRPAGSIGRLENIWGRRGLSNGRLQKPRAIAIDAQDRIYLVDMTARIQVFDSQGKFLRGWQTPDHQFGRPTGLSIDRRGNVIVPDTHYYRVLFYSPEGKLLETLGGKNGNGPGEFGWVTDAVEDSRGNLYVSEYGEYDRIQKFSPDHKYLLEWGSHGSEPGQFVRPQSMAVDKDDHIWVADACNHRIQVFDTQGKLLKLWGKPGQALGELYYPYGLILDEEGHVYVLEYGNHRVQKFTLEGQSLGCWGTHGHAAGEMHNPWALVRDSHGHIFVLDTNNHRVQQVAM
jgi:DNA-binding beta-propeller fold protein YncE